MRESKRKTHRGGLGAVLGVGGGEVRSLEGLPAGRTGAEPCIRGVINKVACCNGARIATSSCNEQPAGKDAHTRAREGT